MDVTWIPGQNLLSLPESEFAVYMAGLDRAANLIFSRFQGPSLLVNVDRLTLPGGIAAGAGANGGLVPYQQVRSVLPYLPESPTFYTNTTQTVVTGEVFLTSHNMKNLGVYDSPNRPSQRDGAIFFTDTLSFDFDQSDGINPGAADFTGLIAHELGHLLGFQSAVEQTGASNLSSFSPALLDYARWSDYPINGDTTPRLDLSSSASPKYFSTDGTPTDILWTNGTFAGGNQGGHFEQGGHLMSPLFSTGQLIAMTDADADALAFMGYRPIPTAPIGAPEPSPILFVILIIFLLDNLCRRGILRMTEFWSAMNGG